MSIHLLKLIAVSFMQGFGVGFLLMMPVLAASYVIVIVVMKIRKD